ncbi:hypothetical protein G6F37_001387 [Rhizopus arrhizus]|nr:hypothetical protein G6F38_000718 [Rhizopus arrhizus]KAG1163250.1 hypothetical protein G6F37_001387 [Rhizopus arrhizus]
MPKTCQTKLEWKDNHLKPIILIKSTPESNQLFPKVTDIAFWSNVSRKVAIGTHHLNTRVRFHSSIPRNFGGFDISRNVPGSDEYAYPIPTLGQLHDDISRLYGATIIQNAVMHLLNTKLWILRIFKGCFLNQQQFLGRLPIMALGDIKLQEFRSLLLYTYTFQVLARKAVDGIVNHRPFENIAFREEDDQEIDAELSAFVNLNEQYNQIRLVYEAEFADVNYDQINDYENASAHPFKYFRLSYRLLQIANSLPNLSIKLWSLIPKSSHSIVHVPLSGVNLLYHLFRKAYDNHLSVPLQLIVHDGTFIRLTYFDYYYFNQDNKRQLWDTLSDLVRIENRAQLAYGMKMDGHMISILFEKHAINFVPQGQKETKIQKTCNNISNWIKGLYPLYKNPFGVIENGRIISIDPVDKQSDYQAAFFLLAKFMKQECNLSLKVVKEWTEKVINFLKNCIFVDESDFDISTRRSRGWSAKGSAAIVETPSTRADLQIVIGATSAFGAVNLTMREISVPERITSGHYVQLISDTMDIINEFPEMREFHIVIDNAPTHVPSMMDTIIIKRGNIPVYLLPYSPELNPIEQFWAVLKSKIKRTKFGDVETLGSRIIGASEAIPAEHLQHFVKHSINQFDNCSNRNPI